MCGSSQPSAPTSSGTTVSELPAWAKGYAKDTLAKAAQLTDINKNPYQPYEGKRNADLAPMQTQAMQGAANMSAGPEAFSKGISGYMSPYMQNVVDIGKREATRQSGIMGQQQQAQAAQAGAFGGGRDAIMRAERERNLSQQMGDIQDKGMQSAYDSAANQFRQGITQDMDINKMQAGYGGMQQAQVQRELDTKYGDFGNQMNYPYKQLGFMSDMIRGLPVGTASSTTQYQAPGSTLGQLGGLGVTALGLSRYMADGGEVHGYAGGGAIDAGEDVDSEENIAGILHMKTDEELRASAQAAAQRGDQEQLRLIQEEFAMRASLQNGLASVVPSGMTGEDVPAGADGGIVAFAERGAVDLGEILDQAREADKNAQKKLYSYGLQQRLQDPQGFAAAQAAKQAAANARATAEKAYAAEMEAKGINKPISAAVPIGAFQIGRGAPSGLPAAASKGPTSQRPTGDSSGFKAYEPPRQQAAAPAGGSGSGGGGGGRPSGAISDNLHPAIAATVDKALADLAASGKVEGNSLLSNYKSMFDMISQGNNADLQVLKDQMTKGDQQIDETKGHALGNILMAFGANWAANASKPGATALGSAAGAAPAAQQEMATQDKILRDMNDVQNKIKMDYTKFQISLKKQDQGTALQAANDMVRNEIAAAQLAQAGAASRGEIALKGIQLKQEAEKALADIDFRLKSLGIQGSQVASQNRRIGVDEKRLEVQERLAGVQERKLRALAMKQFDADPKNQKDYRDLQKTNPKDADFLMGQRRNAYVEDATGFGLSSGLGSGGIRDNTQY
jgi:hypothetical protein